MEKIKSYFSDWTMLEKLWLITVCTIMTVIWYINGDSVFLLVLTLTELYQVSSIVCLSWKVIKIL